MNELIKLSAAAIVMRKMAGDGALPYLAAGVGGAVVYKNRDAIMRKIKDTLLGLVGIRPREEQMSPEQLQQLMGGMR